MSLGNLNTGLVLAVRYPVLHPATTHLFGMTKLNLIAKEKIQINMGMIKRQINKIINMGTKKRQVEFIVLHIYIYFISLLLYILYNLVEKKC